MDYNGFLGDCLITHCSDSGHSAPLGHLMSAFVRFASHYSTVGVLLALCLGFSLATIVDQPLSPKDAARQLAGRISPSDWSRTLIVSTDSREDLAFAEELRQLAPNASDSDFDNRFVRGTPQEIRRAILTRQMATISETTPRSPLLLVQSPDTIAWTLFENAEEKFPGLAIQLLRPETMRWPNFLKSSNLINIVNQIVVIAIIAVGMTLVILTGGIDLSVGSLIALSSVVCARTIRDWGGGRERDHHDHANSGWGFVDTLWTMRTLQRSTDRRFLDATVYRYAWHDAHDQRVCVYSVARAVDRCGAREFYLARQGIHFGHTRRRSLDAFDLRRGTNRHEIHDLWSNHLCDRWK
jgi:hypothetical protein